MKADEDEHLEFKEAKNSYSFEDLLKYCAALANEGGGKIILGVTNRMPREVIGTQAFRDVGRTKAGLVEHLRLRIEADEELHHNGRVLIFSVPSRPLGSPIGVKGAYWMRSGESLIPMTPDQIKKIFEETGPDFSSEVCLTASLEDLDPQAIEKFRAMWKRKSGNSDLWKLTHQQLLQDAELIADKEVTNAALILLGTHKALGKYLGQTEVIFEYRSEFKSGPASQRIDYRQGALLFLEDLWTKINLRNDIQSFRIGLIMQDIPTFNESVVREALLNAVSHRDYRLSGSVFVRQYPRQIEIESPGGFLPGITPENILWKQAPRNRRLAEALAKCGLIERSGQGANRMFEECIRESKPSPDFTGSDEYRVFLTLRGEVQDPRFLEFLQRIGEEKLSLFTTEDLLAVDLIHREQPISEKPKSRLPNLIEKGIVESVGRGKGTRYILSRKFYRFLGKTGVYTRQRGLDRDTNKELLFKHIYENRKEGSRLMELTQVLPAISRGQVQRLLREMESARKIHHTGKTNAARWYPNPDVGEGIRQALR